MCNNFTEIRNFCDYLFFKGLSTTCRNWGSSWVISLNWGGKKFCLKDKINHISKFKNRGVLFRR